MHDVPELTLSEPKGSKLAKVAAAGVVAVAVTAISFTLWASVGIYNSYEAASIAEIQAAAAESACARTLLSNSNRNAVEIRRRDLTNLTKVCPSIDQQAKAFNPQPSSG